MVRRKYPRSELEMLDAFVGLIRRLVNSLTEFPPGAAKQYNEIIMVLRRASKCVPWEG